MVRPELGCTKDDLDTPALCVDLDRMEANIAAMLAVCRSHGIAWRPHAKCHKSIDVARKLVTAGALGVTCAKLGEAEVLASDGAVRDLLIANLVVGRHKLDRLARLCAAADPLVCVDHPAQIHPLSERISAAGQSVRVLIEVDIGLERVGAAPGEPTFELARLVHSLPGLKLSGLMGYEGHLLVIADPVEKARRIEEALNRLVATAELLASRDLPCPIVSCGGTGSYRYAAGHPGITEIQAGGAIFMDEFYRNCCQVKDLGFALTVLTTVVSRPAADRAIIDAGRKSVNGDLQPPRVVGREGLAIESLSAEHGKIRVAPDAVPPSIGERLELIPGYSDLTTVLHDQFFAFRGDRLEAIWPLHARGKLQ